MTAPRALRLSRLALASLIFLLAAANVSRADLNAYARFVDGTGVWAGEATAPGRAGWVVLKSISLGLENPSTIGSTSGGGGSGITKFTDIVLSKLIDRVTPQIFATLSSGTPLNGTAGIPDVILEFTRTVAGTEMVFFRVEMKLVLFTSLTTAAADGDDDLTETVRMQCGAYRITEIPTNPNGTAGTPIVRSWSQVLNRNVFGT